MKFILIAVIFSILPVISYSSTLDCKNLYVGTITSEKDVTHVVFKDSKANDSGSYAQFFTGWTDADKKTAISLLLTAKISGHRVNIATSEVSECDIQTGARNLKRIQLSSNP